MRLLTPKGSDMEGGQLGEFLNPGSRLIPRVMGWTVAIAGSPGWRERVDV
jgi:hypothetical protein